jgi:hypothetical protein
MKKKGIFSTSASPLKHIIPIFKGPWGDKPPGWGQIDTVAPVNYTDAATYWVIPRAQWNKREAGTKESASRRRNCPSRSSDFTPIPEASSSTGWLLKRWCDEQTIDLSRSELGKKNDGTAMWRESTETKERVGAKYKRKYEKTAKTPYSRMLEHVYQKRRKKSYKGA